MNAISAAQNLVQPTVPPVAEQASELMAVPQDFVLISRQELRSLHHQMSCLKAENARLKSKIDERDAQLVLKEAQIKDLKNRLFGKKTEKGASGSSEAKKNPPPGRPKGQQEGTSGHGRTPRLKLPVDDVIVDLPEEKKKCPICGLPYHRRAALDQKSDVIEVLVKAYIRRYHRPAYVPDTGCLCPEIPAIIIAPPPVRLLTRSQYGVSFWVDVMLSKFHYAQPTHRRLQDLCDQQLPVSPGTVAGGLQAILPLFTPIMEVLYCRQMGEKLFFNDETRWPVFVVIEGKVGTRWYLWVTRSHSVIYYNIDPSRSAAVPGAHFAGLINGLVIIVCDRYSAYKKLARLSLGGILLAFCWAHVRRDFLDAGRSIPALETWALEWKERIATLYHLNALRLEHWQPNLPLDQQSAEFQARQQALQESLQSVNAEATRLAEPETNGNGSDSSAKPAKGALLKVAREQQRKIAQSLLNHWPGLSLFLTHPEVPMDNNLGENAIRGPAVGRKNYYGSGSLWSAELAATLFSIFQTLELWGIPQRSWLTNYLLGCAENGGKAPSNIDAILPWSMVDAPITTRPKPPLARPPPAALNTVI